MDDNMDNNKKSLEIALKIKPIENKLLIGLDIGGSLTKMCIIIPKQETQISSILSSKKIFKLFEIDNYLLYLYHFQTAKYQIDILPILEDINKLIKIDKIDATGGGAYKYSDIMKQKFDIEFIKHDELLSLVYGYEFMSKFNSFYEIEEDSSTKIFSTEIKFPHISINIGSGVSFLKVVSPYEFKRVGGTIMGGGTLIGFSKLIIGVDNYDEILELANKGNSDNVDLTMNDLMGGGGDDENSIISSLGKVPDYAQCGKKDVLKKEDIALSLLNMICSEITQYAVLHAEKNNIDTIYYFGTFTKNDSIINKILNKASLRLNKNIKIKFNIFGGYLGCIGSLLEK